VKNIYKVEIDKLIYMIDFISPSEFQEFKDKLSELELRAKICSVNYKIGTGVSEYHYNLHIGRGDGAVYIGWQHNTSKGEYVGSSKVWTMKVEYNPAKTSVEHEEAIALLQKMFCEHTKRLTTLDFCFDVEIDTNSIFVFPKTGKEENRYRGDRYYGHKSNTGYLKVYDKKRERLEKANIYVFPEDEMWRELARIEYTLKIENGITLDLFRLINVKDIGNEYDIRIFKEYDEKIKPEIKACIIAILWGQMQVKDFGRYTKPHIKKAIENSEELALGTLIQGSWTNILNIINKHLYKYEL